MDPRDEYLVTKIERVLDRYSMEEIILTGWDSLEDAVYDLVKDGSIDLEELNME